MTFHFLYYFFHVPLATVTSNYRICTLNYIFHGHSKNGRTRYQFLSLKNKSFVSRTKSELRILFSAVYCIECYADLDNVCAVCNNAVEMKLSDESEEV